MKMWALKSMKFHLPWPITSAALFQLELTCNNSQSVQIECKFVTFSLTCTDVSSHLAMALEQVAKSWCQLTCTNLLPHFDKSKLQLWPFHNLTNHRHLNFLNVNGATDFSDEGTFKSSTQTSFQRRLHERYDFLFNCLLWCIEITLKALRDILLPHCANRGQGFYTWGNIAYVRISYLMWPSRRVHERTFRCYRKNTGVKCRVIYSQFFIIMRALTAFSRTEKLMRASHFCHCDSKKWS